MPFNVTTGVYTPAAGATNAVTGQVIQSAVWNSVHTDFSNALTALAQGTQPLLGNQSFHNVISRNGSFDVWQRGAGGSASITVTGAATVYTADGWYFVANANQTCVASAQAALVKGGIASGRFQRNSGSTGVGTFTLGFPLDVDEVAAIAGFPAALRFQLSTGANWSPTVVVANVFVGTGTPAKQVAGYSGQTNPISTTVAIAPSATATVTVNTGGALVAAAGTQAEVQFSWTPSGTAGANDYLQIDDVQLEANQASTPYDRVPFDVALQRCKRHYMKTFAYTIAPAQNVGVTTGELNGVASNPSTSAINRLIWRFPVSMRVAPTITTYNPSAANANPRDELASADCTLLSGAQSTENYQTNYSGAATTAIGNLIGMHVQADAGI